MYLFILVSRFFYDILGYKYVCFHRLTHLVLNISTVLLTAILIYTCYLCDLIESGSISHSVVSDSL